MVARRTSTVVDNEGEAPVREKLSDSPNSVTTSGDAFRYRTP
jgi:hypothetical protein